MFDYQVPDGMYCYLLDVDFDSRKFAQWAKARWNPQLKSWIYLAPIGAPLPEKLTQFQAPMFSWEAWREAVLNGVEPQTAPSSGDIVLHPHQEQAADVVEKAFNAGRPGVLIGDEVGLGKTFSALAGVNRIEEPKDILILSPLSVVPHWRRSIAALGSHHRFTVINYDRAKKLLETPQSALDAKRTRTKNKRQAAGKRRRLGHRHLRRIAPSEKPELSALHRSPIPVGGTKATRSLCGALQPSQNLLNRLPEPSHRSGRHQNGSRPRQLRTMVQRHGHQNVEVFRRAEMESKRRRPPQNARPAIR